MLAPLARLHEDERMSRRNARALVARGHELLRLRAARARSAASERATDVKSTIASPPLSREQAERHVLDLINRDRASLGLAALPWDEAAARAARRHAEDMAAHGFTAHWGSDGSVPESRYTEAGGEDAMFENVGCFVDGAAQPLALDAPYASEGLDAFERAFMDEAPPHDGHRRNILSRAHTAVGVGVAAVSGSRVPCVAEEFVDDHGDYEPLPRRAHVGDFIEVRGEVRPPAELALVGVARIDLPAPRAAHELQRDARLLLPGAVRGLLSEAARVVFPRLAEHALACRGQVHARRRARRGRQTRPLRDQRLGEPAGHERGAADLAPHDRGRGPPPRVIRRLNEPCACVDRRALRPRSRRRRAARAAPICGSPRLRSPATRSRRSSRRALRLTSEISSPIGSSRGDSIDCPRKRTSTVIFEPPLPFSPATAKRKSPCLTFVSGWTTTPPVTESSSCVPARPLAISPSACLSSTVPHTGHEGSGRAYALESTDQLLSIAGAIDRAALRRERAPRAFEVERAGPELRLVRHLALRIPRAGLEHVRDARLRERRIELEQQRDRAGDVGRRHRRARRDRVRLVDHVAGLAVGAAGGRRRAHRGLARGSASRAHRGGDEPARAR